VAAAIEHVVCTDWADPEWGTPRKAAFVAAARHAHGCTALCLSGGGAIAMYHMGVVRELLAAGVLPSVISGTSGGAIVAALLACRADDELPDFIVEDVSTQDGELWFDDLPTMLRRFAQQGVVVSKDKFLSALYPICGDLTFAEAFARTGRLVNLSTSTTSLGATLLLNHINAPNVLVRSAVQASCALPGVMRPGTLLAKSREGEIVPFESAGLLFRDGSFQSDIPMRELSAQFHASHFLVSQVNGHIAPFLFDPVKPCSLAVRLQRFIVADVRARLDKYAQASYLPTELNNLVTQEYRGKPHDITIFPRLRISDLTCA
jgi:TAG lipase/steryl ester hydrolase/phospholipase A2/LPA acyltransferase